MKKNVWTTVYIGISFLLISSVLVLLILLLRPFKQHETGTYLSRETDLELRFDQVTFELNGSGVAYESIAAKLQKTAGSCIEWEKGFYFLEREQGPFVEVLSEEEICLKESIGSNVRYTLQLVKQRV